MRRTSEDSVNFNYFNFDFGEASQIFEKHYYIDPVVTDSLLQAETVETLRKTHDKLSQLLERLHGYDGEDFMKAIVEKIPKQPRDEEDVFFSPEIRNIHELVQFLESETQIALDKVHKYLKNKIYACL